MNLSAALFVGGDSKRMGVDKALLPLNGAPLWSRQIAVLQQLSPRTIYLSCRSAPKWCPPEVEIVTDATPGRGPLEGLAAVLARIHSSHVLALAVDLPQITPAMLRRIWSLCAPGRGVVPIVGDTREPLCAIYPQEAAEPAQSTLAGGELSLQPLMRTLIATNRMSPMPIAPSEHFLFTNTNSPADWERVAPPADQ